MSSIGFVISNDINEAINMYDFVTLDERIDDFIFKKKDIFGSSVDIFTQINPYEDTIFSQDEIKKFLLASKQLLQEDVLDFLEKDFIRENIDKKEFIKFANNMINMCNIALKENKNIVSIGN
ncbi:hypothetical protein [Tepidibacter formicigenes]|jgi:hypothetical protein|uniref:Uncharacterized protein n=1 Tax=Tepidibacter formicigenes DSM 15518 TaxID=1123349 RepID=A0A1M6PSD7_9FIRM|nr:hypothetical protein [Tepidibacter formicigenes]SHK10857.1 hypothetical protein SAMN02744037_01636 [Tepidibacter formicigenes DSM 15518]